MLKEFRGPKEKADGTFTDDSLRAIRDRVRLAAMPRLGESEGGKRKNVPTLKEKYQANKDVILALENAFRGTIGDEVLKGLQNLDGACALPQGSTRYLVPVTSLPEEIRDCARNVPGPALPIVSQQ